jgi:hypothetical protein
MWNFSLLAYRRSLEFALEYDSETSYKCHFGVG